jgi:hypothetical protein
MTATGEKSLRPVGLNGNKGGLTIVIEIVLDDS